MSDSSNSSKDVVLSPCIGVCALDDNDICIGCYRSGQEITVWGRVSNEEKRKILANVEKRMSGEG